MKPGERQGEQGMAGARGGVGRAGRDARSGWEVGANLHPNFLRFAPPGDIFCTSSGEISTFELERSLQKEMGQEAKSTRSGQVSEGVKPR